MKTLNNNTMHSRNRILFSLCLLFGLFVLPASGIAQCDAVADKCSVNLLDFLSDGQYYRAQVVEGEEAQLKITFFEGFTYRISACSDSKEGQVQYEMFDGSNAKVFSSKDIPGEDYWDFQIGATDEFTIKASLTKGMGCIVFEIGYDDEMYLDLSEWTEEDDPFFEDELEDELEYDLDKDEAEVQ